MTDSPTPRILARPQAPTDPTTAREQKFARLLARVAQIVIDGLTGLLRQLELDRTSCFVCRGRNVAIEYPWAYGDSDRLPELASDLINRLVTVIATPGSVAAALVPKPRPRRSRSCTVAGSDPVEVGLVDTLSATGD